MIFRPRTPKRHPKHARPSVLAPTRTVLVLGGFGVLTAAVVAGCATVTGGTAGAAQSAARPATIRELTAAGAGGAAVQRLGAADFGAPPAAVLAARAPISSGGGPSAAAQAPDAAPVSGLAASGIPSTALAAYRQAAAGEATRAPGCGIGWPLLAGIGRVESNHGRFAGAVLHADGVSTPRIIGIPLDGHGTALIRDTDGGRLDGDTRYDRAVGPMQFIPSTWAGWGADGNGDGVKDPFNVFDAAAAAAHYLCAAGRDLRTAHGQVQAILSYNYSYDYVSMVMGLEKIYAAEVGITVPVLPTAPSPRHGRPAHKPKLPPVDPGHPGGVTPPAPPKHRPSSGTSSSPASPSSSAPSSSSASSPATGSSGPTSPPASDSCGPSSPAASSSSSSPADSSASSSSPAPGCPSAVSGTGSSAAGGASADTAASAPGGGASS